MTGSELPPNPGSERKKAADTLRKERVKISIVASIVSKLFGAALPLFILPLAIKELGASYNAIIALLTLAGIFNTINLGMGPAMSYKLSKYAIDGNPQQERMLFISSFFSALASSLILAILIIIAAAFLPMSYIFGPNLSEFEPVLRLGLAFLGLVVVVVAIHGSATNMYTGYMEIHKIRFTMAASYLVSAIAAPIVILLTKSAFWTFVVYIGTPAFLQVLLVIKLLYFDRPYLKNSLKDWDKSETVKIFKDNVYQSAADLGQVAARQFPVICAGFIGASAVTVGQSGTFLIWLNTILQIFIMVLGAVSATISNAYQENDWNWIDRSNSKLWRILITFGIPGALLLTFVGPIAINFAYSSGFTVTPIECGFLAVALLVASFMTWFSSYIVALGMFRESFIGGIIQALAVTAVIIPASKFNGFIYIGICLIVADAARGLYLFTQFNRKRSQCLAPANLSS